MTARIAIPENVERDLARPGPWWWGFKPGDDGKPSAPLLRCPGGHTGILRGHKVEATGAVYPSIVCAETACTWHVWGTLAGWACGERAPDPD